MKKKYALLLFFIIANNAFGQQNNALEAAFGKKIRALVSENIIIDNIKDSTAVYFMLIKINIRSKGVGRGCEVAVDLNNKSVAGFFVGLDKLKQLDYSSLLKNNKKLDLFIRSEILVYGSKYNNAINIADLEESLKYMHASRPNPFYEMFGVRLVIDKKVYH